MTEKKKAKLIPQRRFKEFIDAGEWEEKSLGEIAEVTGGGTPSTQVAEYWNGNINWFTPAEIGDQPFVKESSRKISSEGLYNSSAKLMPAKRSILFTSRASKGGFS